MRKGNSKKSNYKSNRNYKGNNKPKTKGNKMEREDEVKDYSNDPAWYAQTPELLRDSASIPFSFSVGTPFTQEFWYKTLEGRVQTQTTEEVVPGIMTMTLIPAVGYATDPTSPINTAAARLYSFVRHANSGHANYDAPDLMIYCVAMGQIYSYINYLMRVYGTCQLYANMNRYLPRAIIESQGVDFDNLIENLANFRYGINALIVKAASFAVPADITYFRRLAFLFSGIYSEGDSVKSQLYMFNPLGFLKFTEVDNPTGGMLMYTPLEYDYNNKIFLTTQNLIDYGNELLNPIVYSEDMNIMSGDILKAYGTSGILKLAPISEQLSIAPVPNLEVLEQFQNSTLLEPSSLRPTDFVVTLEQNATKGWLKSTVEADWPKSSISPKNFVLNTILTDPNPADVIERTRFMCRFSYSGTSGTPEVKFCTEIPTGLYITQLQGGVSEIIQIYTRQHVGSQTTNYTTAWSLVKEHCLMENFKFHPMMFYVKQEEPSGSTGDSTFEDTAVALDFDNYTIVAPSVVDRMNEAALLSLFNVQSVASTNSF